MRFESHRLTLEPILFDTVDCATSENERRKMHFWLFQTPKVILLLRGKKYPGLKSKSRKIHEKGTHL